MHNAVRLRDGACEGGDTGGKGRRSRPGNAWSDSMADELVLDHVVVLVQDLDEAVAGWTAAGFTVQRGGRHAAGSTHNALVGLADGSYIELIAFVRHDAAHRWHRFAEQRRWGLVDAALLPDSVPAAVARAAAAGLAYQGPQDGGRTRPDGAVLRWQIATPPTPELPFLCGDLTPRALRVPEGAVRRHANGASGVAVLTMQVDNLAQGVARWTALLGRGPSLAPSPLPGFGLAQAAFALGPTTVALVQPVADGATASGPVGARPAGPVGLALRVPQPVPGLAPLCPGLVLSAG